MKNNRTREISKGGIYGGSIALLLNVIYQWNAIKEDPNLDFDLNSVIKSTLQGAVIGASITSFWLLIISLFESGDIDESDIDEVTYLSSVVTSCKMDNFDQKTLRKSLRIKKALKKRYHSEILGRPTHQGSVKQKTSVTKISDFDIRISFKKTSFRTLEEMYYSVLDYFRYEFEDTDLIKVRKQRRSIGLIYNIDGEKTCIDVVPGRRTDVRKGGNEYHLYENPENIFGNASRIKMNPYKQEDFGDNVNDKREIIKLLKILREKKDVPMKSILIKELTKKALENINYFNSTIIGNLKITLKYIIDNIETIRIVSPDNTNNVISELMSNREKTESKEILKDVLNNIENDPRCLREYFPSMDLF